MKDRRGQGMLEYAILIAIVVAALIAMQGYIRRAIQGKYRAAADVFGQGEQYEPGLTQVE